MVSLELPKSPPLAPAVGAGVAPAVGAGVASPGRGRSGASGPDRRGGGAEGGAVDASKARE